MKSRSERGESQREADGSLYDDEAWNTCHRGINPSWILTYKIISFLVLLALIIANVVVDGGGIMYFYTQWTFTLLGSSFSIYGCFLEHNKYGGGIVDGAPLDAEQGNCAASSLDGSSDMLNLPGSPNRESQARKTASAIFAKKANELLPYSGEG
ncbi:hypothetical protein RIF29_33101 [Crotalaria pallida]|uniref:Uncharacterized protein n=1 Tax=Crotalaria pallida TaxID=3830 RepID=A0AAN9HSK1_CROPI